MAARGVRAVAFLLISISRRPARLLAASRFTSHSQGAGSVSSKSLMSKTSRRSGVPNPPKLARGNRRRLARGFRWRELLPDRKPSERLRREKKRTAIRACGRSESGADRQVFPDPSASGIQPDRGGPAEASTRRATFAAFSPARLFPQPAALSAMAQVRLILAPCRFFASCETAFRTHCARDVRPASARVKAQDSTSGQAAQRHITSSGGETPSWIFCTGREFLNRRSR